MNTIPGHNIIIQQSGAVNEVTQGTNSPKPNPEQTEALQNANVIEQGTTVQGFEESERLKEKKETARQRRERERKRKKREQEQKEQDPDATGKILDTII